jgi:putative transposase
MAESQSMTTAEVVAKTLIAEHGDFLREAVALLARELMEAEISGEIGAAREEVSSDRSTHRNGYRPAAGRPGRGDRAGDPPQARGRGLLPELPGGPPPCRAGALGGGDGGLRQRRLTRKVNRLVSQLGISGVSKDRVSAICRSLDERVTAFRERPLEEEYPYFWLDAKHVKARYGGHVRSKAVVIAYGVHSSGRREVIDLDVGEVESGAFWVEFLRRLRARGLAGVRLCASDAHEGLQGAIARVLGCPWQRCTVHFVRDMHQHCRPAQRGMVSAALREVFAAEGHEQARERAGAVIERLAPSVPTVAELLEEAEEDLIASYRFPAAHWSKLRSTNPLERVNREVGRRSDVVGVFPDDASVIRLVGALLIEQNDEWLVARRHLSEESLALVLEDQGEEGREEVAALQVA